MLLDKCFAGSVFSVGLLCSLQCFSTFLLISFEHLPLYITQGCRFLLLTLNSDFTRHFYQTQQDTSLVTSVTCLCGKFWCLLQKTNKHIRPSDKHITPFLLQFKNHNWMNKWSQMLYTFFQTASHEGCF